MKRCYCRALVAKCSIFIAFHNQHSPPTLIGWPYKSGPLCLSTGTICLGILDNVNLLLYALWAR